MSKEVKYEIVLEQVNELAKTMKHLFDVLEYSPREAERIAKNAPIVVGSFATEDEAIAKKDELGNDGSAEYSINETEQTYKVIIRDFNYDAEAKERTSVLRALCYTLGINLNEAVELAKKTPLVVKEDISIDEAEEIQSSLLRELANVCSDIRIELDF